MGKEMLPVGVRRDGSYYTRIEWCSHTTNDPLTWVNNLIDDDTERNGGTWGANTMGPANAILSFFGETQVVSKVRIFHNVGVPHSYIEELASIVNIYVSRDDAVRQMRSRDSQLNETDWIKVLECQMEKREGWFEFELKKQTEAKYIRIELVKNFGTPDDCPWTETNELKIY